MDSVEVAGALPSPWRLAAFFLRESDLDELPVRKGERIDEAETLARSIGIDVDLVAFADHEQSPVADPEPAKPVRTDRFHRPYRRRAVRVLHVEVEPGMGICPVDLFEHALEDHVLGHVELRLDRMMGLRRGARSQAEGKQRD